MFFFFFSSRRRHTRFDCDWSSDVCSSDLEKLGEILVRLRLITEDRLVPFLSRHYGIPEVAFPERIAPETIAVIPSRIARKYGVVPIGRTPGSVTLAVGGPTNPSGLGDAAFLTGPHG